MRDSASTPNPISPQTGDIAGSQSEAPGLRSGYWGGNPQPENGGAGTKSNRPPGAASGTAAVCIGRTARNRKSLKTAVLLTSSVLRLDGMVQWSACMMEPV